MPKPSRPNILFVFADQLRGSSVGYAGQEPVLTPNLDAFAQQGVRFTRAVANAPVCCAMRASMLTGLHPLSHGVVTNDVPLREDVPSIAKSLASAGYNTGYIGKWHLDGPDRGCFTPPGPRRQGFDYWAVCNCNHNYLEAFYYRDSPEPIWMDGYEPTGQTDLAIDYLRRASQGNDPFCLFVSWGPPHCPYDQVPDRFKRMYDPESLPVRPNSVRPDRQRIANYYAHVSALDWNFGRLMDSLEESGLAENTLVIFTSDHGDMLCSHDRGWKNKPWAESAIVPCAARLPGRTTAGHAETAPFGLVNIAPSLLGLCGVPIPQEMEGSSYPQMLTGEAGPRPESTPIYSQMGVTYSSTREWRGVVTRQHTYARYTDRAWVLYDDEADPYQTVNLVRSSDNKDLKDGMEKLLAGWLERMGDKFETTPELARRLGIELDDSCTCPYYFQPEILAEMHRRSSDKERRMREG